MSNLRLKSSWPWFRTFLETVLSLTLYSRCLCIRNHSLLMYLGCRCMRTILTLPFSVISVPMADTDDSPLSCELDGVSQAGFNMVLPSAFTDEFKLASVCTDWLLSPLPERVPLRGRDRCMVLC